MKTIFVSLWSNIVLGNFDIPGGVLDELVARKNKDTRLIFLTLDGFRPRLERFVNGGAELVTIERPRAPNAFQKLFQFFYAYLIFTDTTRILATFGARADVPPAGGNRHLAFVKAFVARTFGRSRTIKTKFVPWCYGKLFGRTYQELFERYKPDMVFLPNIAFSPDVDFALEARRRGIASVGMACNWDHLNKYFIPIQTDSLLVQNAPMQFEAVTLQAYRPEQVFPVGFVQFDAYARYQDFAVSREQFFKKFGIPLDNKLILFISGAAYSLDEPDVIRTIVQWMAEWKLGNKVRLMIRPYVIARDKANEEKKFKEFVDHPLVVFNYMRRDESEETRNYYLGMLYYADVIIPIFSTMAIEAAIFDKPTISIGFDGYKKRPKHQSITRLEELSHFRHVLQTGSVKVVRNFDELFWNLDRYLKFPETDREKRKILIEKMCYKVDGMSSARVVDFVFGQLPPHS